MGFNENLKLLLLEKNMKQADLCRMTGIQTSLMSEYINGRKSPTIGNAILIADALNISLDDLIFISFFSGIIFSGTIFLRYRSSMIT